MNFIFLKKTLISALNLYALSMIFLFFFKICIFQDFTKKCSGPWPPKSWVLKKVSCLLNFAISPHFFVFFFFQSIFSSAPDEYIRRPMNWYDLRWILLNSCFFFFAYGFYFLKPCSNVKKMLFLVFFLKAPYGLPYKHLYFRAGWMENCAKRLNNHRGSIYSLWKNSVFLRILCDRWVCK